MKIWQKFFILLLFLPSSNFIGLEKTNLDLQSLASKIQTDHPDNPLTQIANCNRLIERTESLLSNARDGFPLYDFAIVKKETEVKRLKLQVYQMYQRLHMLKRASLRTTAHLAELQQMGNDLQRWEQLLPSAQWQDLNQEFKHVSANLLLGSIRALHQVAKNEDKEARDHLVLKVQEFIHNYPEHQDISEVQNLLH